MAYLDICLGLVAPYYNLILVIIIMHFFIRLLSTRHKKLMLKPWRILFAAVCIYIVEEILTILNSLGVTNTPRIFTSVFEFVIITIFIYMLLIQKEISKK